MNPPFLPPSFAPGPPTAPVREIGPATFVPYNGSTQTGIINSQPPYTAQAREIGPGPADPNLSASYDATYVGSGRGQVAQGTINVGAPFTAGPEYPNAQLRFYIQGGILYALDNISGQSFFVSASGISPVPPNYSATRPT